MRCRVEAVVALALWMVAGAYSITVCYFLGYYKKVQDLKLIWGMPHWTVYGVLIPWVVLILANSWYSLVYLQDDDLGEDLHLEDKDLVHSSHNLKKKP